MEQDVAHEWLANGLTPMIDETEDEFNERMKRLKDRAAKARGETPW